MGGVDRGVWELREGEEDCMPVSRSEGEGGRGGWRLYASRREYA